MKRWIVRILGGLAGVVILGACTLYVLSQRVINARHSFREYAIQVPPATDTAALARGARLAKLRCIGCHGDSLQGNPEFFNAPMIAHISAANVPAKLATMTDAEFAGFMRYAVRKDGTSPFVMPPIGFYHLSDADLADLITYLRTLPVPATQLPPASYGPMGRLGVVLGQFKTSFAYYDTTQARVGADTAWSGSRYGEYLARSICTECHTPALTGDPTGQSGPAPTPSIVMAAGYSREQFHELLRNGTPRAAPLPTMSEVAKVALTHLTDAEIDAIYGYLQSLPATGVK